MAHEILIVDDEPDIRLLVDGILRDEGYETRQAGGADEALAAFRHRRPGLVVLDVWLQGSKLDGIGILQALHREEPQVPVVMISGHGTIEMAVAAIQHGRLRFHRKAVPDRPAAAGRAPRAGGGAPRARERRAAPARRPGDGADRRQQRDRRSCARRSRKWRRPARACSSPGPAGCRQGSGGAHAARALAPRRRAVRRAELRDPQSRPLRGGAVRRRGGHDPLTQPRRAGVLERAHGGTLLLDEVSDMPLETQGKIVRALQEQTFERVGGASRVKVDVRVILDHQPDLQARNRRRPVPRGPVLPAGRGAAAGAGAAASGARTFPPLARHFLHRSAESFGHAGRASFQPTR